MPIPSVARWTSPGPFVQRVTGSGPLLVVVVVVMMMVIQWRTVDAERVGHHRGDQRRNESPKRNIWQTMNYTEAVHYLQKYGYLEHCRPFHSSSSSSSSSSSTSRDSRSATASGPAMTPEVSEAAHAPADCSAQAIADAFRLLQQRFRLAPTGRLDDATRSLMGRGRCGNSDAGEGNDGEEGGIRRRRRRRDVDALPWQPRLPSDRRKDDFIEEGDPYSSVYNHHHHHPQQQPRSSKRRRREQQLEEIADRNRRNHGNDDGVTSSLRDRRNDGNNGDGVTSSLRNRRNHGNDGVTSSLRNLGDHGNDEMTSSLRNRRNHGNVVTSSLYDRFLRMRRRRRRRSRRTISIGEVSEGSAAGVKVKFQRDESTPVQWRLLNDGVSGKIPLADQRAILELSFRMWSEVIPLRFVEANDVSIGNVDVMIAFAKQTHRNCDKPFDGLGGELAHSWTAGDIHFDEDENYKRVIDPSGSGSGIDLLKVAVHEVGHVLGLLHKDQAQSIMYPIYINSPTDVDDDFELSLVDRRDVQKIYGVCKGTFDVVFDWLRKVPSSPAAGPASSASSGQDPVHRPRYIFNTYFFRNNRYWMYENRFNRTRFGDPLYVSRGWTGITGQVNAYAQVISASGQEYVIDTYFFVGDSYYKYNDQTDRVEDGYPRRISADFGAKSSDNESIPNDLDAVLFDNRDSLLYFFKGEWVWTYDPREIGRNGCCEGKVRFSDLFPVDPSNSTAAAEEPPLTGSLSTVFYSYHFHTIFFFKGETVYENAAYNEKTPSVNRLKRLGTWYQIWFDICDVE